MAPPSKLANAAADAISSPAPGPCSAATAAAAVAAAAAAREPAGAVPRPVGLPPGLHLPHAGRAAGQHRRHALNRGHANAHKPTRGHAGTQPAAAAAAPAAGTAAALPSPSLFPACMQQHQQQAVRGGGAAACAVSDSHAAGVASSVGSNASVVWSFLRAADRLAAAFPSYTTLNLNFVEPLPMAAAAVAAGPEAGSSRWLQAEVISALQRLLDVRLTSLVLSGHIPYPLTMTTEPIIGAAAISAPAAAITVVATATNRPDPSLQTGRHPSLVQPHQTSAARARGPLDVREDPIGGPGGASKQSAAAAPTHDAHMLVDRAEIPNHHHQLQQQQQQQEGPVATGGAVSPCTLASSILPVAGGELDPLPRRASSHSAHGASVPGQPPSHAAALTGAPPQRQEVRHVLHRHQRPQDASNEQQMQQQPAVRVTDTKAAPACDVLSGEQHQEQCRAGVGAGDKDEVTSGVDAGVPSHGSGGNQNDNGSYGNVSTKGQAPSSYDNAQPTDAALVSAALLSGGSTGATDEHVGGCGGVEGSKVDRVPGATHGQEADAEIAEMVAGTGSGGEESDKAGPHSDDEDRGSGGSGNNGRSGGSGTATGMPPGQPQAATGADLGPRAAGEREGGQVEAADGSGACPMEVDAEAENAGVAVAGGVSGLENSADGGRQHSGDGSGGNGSGSAGGGRTAAAAAGVVAAAAARTPAAAAGGRATISCPATAAD